MGIVLQGADCHKAAAILTNVAPEAPSPQLMRVCAGSLQEIADIGSDFTRSIYVALPFLVEADKKIHTLCAANTAYPRLVHDLAFELTECLAVLAKEDALRMGWQHVPIAQKTTMRHFENCGEWSADDGTLVTQYYHRLIPSIW